MSALLLLLASTFLVLAQTPDKTDTDRQPVVTRPTAITRQPVESSKPTRPDGIWPSQKLMHSMLTRWADTISDEFELNDEERQKARKAIVNRWRPFLNENRDTIQPLFNEFLEMRLGVEPPDDDTVSRWAERALPAFQKFQAQAGEGTAEFRELLPPDKRADFAAKAIKLGVGLGVAEQKLKQWQQGIIQPDEVWTPRRSQRRARAKAKKKALESAQSAASVDVTSDEKAEPDEAQVDQVAEELGRWDKFVDDVIQRHEYTKAQQTAAVSFLDELKQRAVAHSDRRKEDIARIEYRIRHNTGKEEELASIEALLVELYGPIDDLFKELQTRVESIATTRQKNLAAEKTRKVEPKQDE